MTTPARSKEADRATLAYSLALAKIGAATIEEALELWAGLPVGAHAALVERWHEEAIQAVLYYRSMSRELALAYYRLLRALRTGRTVPLPGEPVKTSVTLGELRHEFGRLVRETDKLYSGPPTTAAKSQEDEEVEVVRARDEYNYLHFTEGNDEPVPKDDVDLDDDFEPIEQEALSEAEEVLETLGPELLDKKLDEIDEDKPAREVDAERQAAHDEAGARQAAAAERIALDGARDTVVETVHRDKDAIGYAIHSTTGTPCGWCAMHISRGVVYKSRRSAKAVVSHDNCKCEAVPVFYRREFEEGDTFALNRQYAVEWRQVTRGYSGKGAIAKWRRHIRAQARSQ